MANGFKGEVSVTHDGKSYTMVMDFNAMCEFEDQTGKNAMKVLDHMENATASDLRALMWACLRQHHPDMTLPLAGSILSENADAIARAGEKAWPEPEAASGVKQGNAKRPAKARA